MLDKLAPYAKAVVGFIAPGASILIASVLPASDGGATITTAELITAVCTCVITAAGVYAIPNRPQS